MLRRDGGSLKLRNDRLQGSLFASRFLQDGNAAGCIGGTGDLKPPVQGRGGLRPDIEEGGQGGRAYPGLVDRYHQD